MGFGRAGGRELVAAFDSGRVTSEAGALLLGATDQAIRLVDRFAACFRDGRHPAFVTHRVQSLEGQRIFGLRPWADPKCEGSCFSSLDLMFCTISWCSGLPVCR